MKREMELFMKICQNCHTPATEEDQRFCVVCGAPLSESPDPDQTRADLSSASSGQSLRPLYWVLLSLFGFLILTLLSALLFLLAARSFAEKSSSDPASYSSGYAPSAYSDEAPSAPEAVPSESETLPEADGTRLVLHNAAENASLTVNGMYMDFTYSNGDAFLPLDALPDICQIRMIADNGDGSWSTSAVVYVKDRGSELSFDETYTPCSSTGLGQPTSQFLDALTSEFYREFLSAINAQDPSLFLFSTAENTARCADEISYYTANSYNLSNYIAVCDPASVLYDDQSSFLIYNGHFMAERQSRSDGSTSMADHYRTLRLVWTDGMWKVDAYSLLPDGSYASDMYATLP